MFDKINSGDALTLYINFETGKYSIKSDSQTIIDELYKMLSTNPTLKIVIEGHTDNVGNATSNKTLSEQRASSVNANAGQDLINMDEITALLEEQKAIEEEGKKLLEQAPQKQQLQYETIK
jgi:outer membrane protein OmpA-like peptidoglycan-associated protein